MNRNWMKVLFIPLFAATLVACPPTVNDKITGIDATATPASVSSGGISSLVATVSGTGAFNGGVNWSIVSGGGNLSGTTGTSVSYTAPTVTSNTVVQIKAVAEGDSSISKTIQVSVTVTNSQSGVWDTSNWDAATWQ